MRKQTDIFKSFWNQIIIGFRFSSYPFCTLRKDIHHGKTTCRYISFPFNDGSCIYQLFCTCPMLLKGRKKEFWVINTLLILFLSIVQHEWLYYISGEQNLMTYPYQNLCRKQREQVHIPTHLFYYTQYL